MRDTHALTPVRVDPFAATLVAAIVLVVLRAVLDGRAMQDNFATMDNDDILRLVMVRDFIAGQGWFDMTQYRLLPPQGVVMHWSRYIDAGIAAIIVPLSWLVPIETAEQLAVTIWPTAILGLTVLVIGYGTRRVLALGLPVSRWRLRSSGRRRGNCMPVPAISTITMSRY